MLFSEEDAPLLKKWIVKRLEDTYEDPNPHTPNVILTIVVPQLGCGR